MEYLLRQGIDASRLSGSQRYPSGIVFLLEMRAFIGGKCIFVTIRTFQAYQINPVSFIRFYRKRHTATGKRIINVGPNMFLEKFGVMGSGDRHVSGIRPLKNKL